MNTSSILKIIALVVVCSATCSYGDLLEYKCEIPEGLEQMIVITAKDGTEREDAHQIYRDSHRLEWFNRVRRHLIKGDPPLHLLFREDLQELGIQSVARRAGMLEAELMIIKASLIHQPDKIDDLLRKILSKEINSEQDGTGQPATRPESKSEGSDKPQSEAEGRSR